MKLVQLISEFRELIEEITSHYPKNGAQSSHRDFVCVTFRSFNDHDEELDQFKRSIIELIRSNVCRTTPVIPDAFSKADLTDQIKNVLGREFHAVVVDGTASLPDDVLGAAAGAVKFPGILVLLLRDGMDSSSSADPYELYLKKKLRTALQPYSKRASLWRLPNATKPSALVGDAKMNRLENQQQTVMDTIIANCLSESRSLDIVVAPRGRGKSTVLGKTIAQLFAHLEFPADALEKTHECSQLITVTATHPNQAVQLIRSAQNKAQESLRFTPLDKALSQAGNVLAVDEAGSVPLAVLKELTQRYRHVILAGTADGYEGSGRAFELKLLTTLTQGRAQNTIVNHHQLHHPIRWPEGDSVERLINDILQISNEPNSLQFSAEPLYETKIAASLSYRKVTPEQLLNNDNLLNAVFALLRHAHYQTTTRDLRHLLNQHKLSLYGQFFHDTLIAACLIAHEGELSAEQVDGIKRGTRRPAHQRLPMLLHRQCQDDDALTVPCWRIIRIAVQPTLQGRGYGTQLLSHVFTEATQTVPEECSAPTFLGASFGINAEGLKFWLNAGYSPIHWGYKLNPRSGQRTITVAKSINKQLSNNSVRSIQTLIETAKNITADSALALHKIHGAAPEWLKALYKNSGLANDPYIELLLNTKLAPGNDTTLSNENPTMDEQLDSQRLELLQNNHLSLHETWGPVARQLGGENTATQWPISGDSAKRVTKQIKACVHSQRMT